MQWLIIPTPGHPGSAGHPHTAPYTIITGYVGENALVAQPRHSGTNVAIPTNQDT